MGSISSGIHLSSYYVFVSIFPLQSLFSFGNHACSEELKKCPRLLIKWDSNSSWIKRKLHTLGTFRTLGLFNLKWSWISSLEVKKPVNPFITQSPIISLCEPSIHKNGNRTSQLTCQEISTSHKNWALWFYSLHKIFKTQRDHWLFILMIR